jgi:hypothetical protein
MRLGKMRSTVEARLKYAMIGGTISQKKKRCQKYPHHEGRTSVKGSADFVVGLFSPVVGVWASLSATG